MFCRSMKLVKQSSDKAKITRITCPQLTFSITCHYFHFGHVYYFLALLKLHIIENKCPHVVTESIRVEMTLKREHSV